jgi:CRISPR-associated protein Cas1
LSFVYDIADLVKTETSMPAAFEAAAGGAEKVESRARRILRDRCCHERLQDRLTKAVPALFAASAEDVADATADGVAALWDGEGTVSGGRLHGGDDS